MIPLLALVCAAGLTLIAAGFRVGRRVPSISDPVQARLLAYGALARHAPDAGARDQSFHERMIRPRIESLRARIVARLPVEQQRELAQQLEFVGEPLGMSASDFVILRFAATVAAFTLGIVLALPSGRLALEVVAAGVLALLAYWGVGYWLRRAVRSRRAEYLVALPAAIDLLVVCIEAGLTFDAALDRLVDKYHNPLTEGLGGVLAEIRLGAPRLEALERFSRRSGVPELLRFSQAIGASQRMGVPLAQVVRTQADDVRFRRRERARQLGATAPVKMVVPMVLFIFPTIWIVLLGPALFALARGGI
ncbi:MAG TPA: type II secretion system F family protein [Candidatus Nitrosotalea sp.]|nr:type II secretion system F family protein [Candidatus Nitrosotalea sp.]